MTRAEEVIVIGAGPAGLSLGWALKQRGVRFRILEAGAAPGDSWRRMPRRMTMNSPWGVNALPGTRVGCVAWAKRLTRAEYAAYLESYAREHALPIEPGVRVARVERTAGGALRVRTAEGALEAERVVSATGYFGAPFVPEMPGARTTRIAQVTACDYGDTEALAAKIATGGRRVLVVGKRITAGQLAVELYDADYQVALSCRSRIEYAWAPELQALGWRAFYPWERRRLARDPIFARGKGSLPMAGGRARHLVESGRIRAIGPIARLGEDFAELADGTREAFDAVLWATGFRPVTSHLAGLVPIDDASGLPRFDGPTSLDAPGLYFLGLDGQTDYTSRMLRGIHRDALDLASRLARRSE
jgi:putative flavoprotein involved in K+ transport